MHHDRVLLRYEEKVVLAELTAGLPADDWWLAWQLGDVDDDEVGLPDRPDASDRPRRPARPDDGSASEPTGPRGEPERRAAVGPLPLALIGVLALITGGLLAAFTTGAAAWCGMVTWIAGTVITLWAVATAEAVPGEISAGV